MAHLYCKAGHDKPSRRRTVQDQLCKARQGGLPWTIYRFLALCNSRLGESFAFILDLCFQRERRLKGNWNSSQRQITMGFSPRSENRTYPPGSFVTSIPPPSLLEEGIGRSPDHSLWVTSNEAQAQRPSLWAHPSLVEIILYRDGTQYTHKPICCTPLSYAEQLNNCRLFTLLSPGPHDVSQLLFMASWWQKLITDLRGGSVVAGLLLLLS